VEQRSLDTLRIEIDAIDDEIHSLLMSRTNLVTEVGNVKQRAGNHAFSLRPAREAAMIRRLVAQHQGPFPVNALIRIWRELLSGQVRVQTPFSVAVCDGDDPVSYRGLVRDQFSGAPVKSFSAPENAIAEVHSGASMVAVVPLPARNTAESWWVELAFGNHQNLKIIGLLPFLPENNSDPVEAFSVAAVHPEPSGKDVSLAALECDAEEFDCNMLDAQPSCQLLSQLGQNNGTVEGTKRVMVLVSVEGFLHQPDDLLSLLPLSLKTSITQVAIIGCYPKQLNPSDIPETP
jgi:chorismate mutase/prephenate dehydratase